jgi:regulator of replication initiation timing
MKTLEEYINSINQRLQQLHKKYTTLQKENAMLSIELEKSKEFEKDSIEKIDSLEMQASILKASAGKMNEKEKQNFDRRINRYIKDIDKCIGMLNN